MKRIKFKNKFSPGLNVVLGGVHLVIDWNTELDMDVAHIRGRAGDGVYDAMEWCEANDVHLEI